MIKVSLKQKEYNVGNFIIYCVNNYDYFAIFILLFITLLFQYYGPI